MVRWFVAVVVMAAFALLFTTRARAEVRRFRVPLLPSIVTSPSRSLFTTSLTGAPDPDAVEGTGLLPSLYRGLKELRPSTPTRAGDLGPRDMRLRDRARDHEATSFGIRAAPLSGSGVAFAGAGIGAGALRLLLDRSLHMKLPVSIGPTMHQGGGGLSLKGPW